MKQNALCTFLLYLMASVIPLLTTIYNFPLYASNELFLFLLPLVSSVVALFMCYKKPLYRRLICLFLLVGCVIFFGKSIFLGSIYTYNQIVDIYMKKTGLYFEKMQLVGNNDQQNFVILMLFLEALISLSMWQLFKYKLRILIIVLSVLLALPSLFFQIDVNWICMGLLFILWFLLLVEFDEKKLILFWQVRLRQLGLVGLFCFFIISGVMNILSEENLKAIYSPQSLPEALVDHLNSFMTYLSTKSMKDDQLDLNTAGNRYYTGAKHLQVHRKKREGLYLKYYSGAVYENNSWKLLDEADYQKYVNINFDDALIWSSNMYYDDEIITVTDLRRGHVYAPMPYYVFHIASEYDTYYDAFMMLKNQNDPVLYQVYDKNRIGFRSLGTAYFRFVMQYYVQLNDDVLSLFQNQLKIKKEQLNIETAHARIMEIFRDYRYTLTPGSLPSGKDFLEYFFVENKKGYCVHFATAATMLFRYYGIPARYAEGYYVSENQFDDEMNVLVEDYDAHAWVEVFDAKIGWMPIEVTPSSSTSSNNSSFQEPDSKPPQSNGNTNQTNGQLPIDHPDEPSVNQPDAPVNEQRDSSMLIRVGIFMGIVFGYGVYRKLRLTLRVKKCRQKDRRRGIYELYCYMMQIEAYHQVMNEEVRSLFEKNRFSQYGLDEKEIQELFDFSKEAAQQVYTCLPIYQKIVFKYVKCLI